MLLLPWGHTGKAGVGNDQTENKPASFHRDESLSGSWGRRALGVAIWTLASAGLAGFGLPAHAAGVTYYINNLAGSNCSDSGPHSMEQPWCTFTPVNAIRTFAPGDQILLARGAAWNQEMSVRGRGTAADPITLGAYGTGQNPKILRNQATNDICVLVMDASYWNISNLEVGRASVGILMHYTQMFNNGIRISNIFAHDNKGIWGGYSVEYPVSHKVLDPFATSLNINLSAGILFNVASYLTYSGSQYVLKDVQVSDVRGENNLDSVSFDAEESTVENQDGHNAFQDVVLNGLFLSNDNGHAGRAYQRAGLGCSDALRLLGMTNLTVMNSVLFDEAGCHTPTGTAAVILGRVSQVRFVNNIIFAVPPSNSPDETGIDFEWSEDNVALQANLFAGNAGPGLEILNIHRGDHTTIDFVGNTFAQNAHARQPGAASVWQDQKGRDCGTPSGNVRNNFYFEQHGRFLQGRNVGSIKEVNNLQTALIADYAAEQFSSTPAKYQWRYIYQSADSTWAVLPKYSAWDNGAWKASDSQYVSAFNLSPASCTGACDSGGVARVWVAPRKGTISIRGRVLKSDAQGGNGVQAAINVVSGRNVTQIWPSQGRQLVDGTDRVGYATDVDNIPVNVGDEIRFEIHANGDNAHDTVSWTPAVAYVTQSRESASTAVNGKSTGY